MNNFPESKNLFCFWADDNEMSETRKKCLESLPNTEMNIRFLDKTAIKAWELEEHPFHPGYRYLSATHKSDYLRAYFMHHYGGGYTDIKYVDFSWLPAFNRLIHSDAYIEGYPEIGIIGITRTKGLFYFLKLAFIVNKLVGCGAFLCKPRTPFTNDWMDSVHQVLDQHYKSLKANPASGPLDFVNMKFTDGSRSKYPLTHSAFSGEVFHLICSKYTNKIGRTLTPFDFKLPYK